MIDHWLNRTLEVWRRTLTDDGAGGQVSTWSPRGTVRAMVSQPSAGERILAEQAGAEQRFPIHLAPGADVVRGDELRGDGQTFRVLATVTPSSPRYLRADCELVQPEPGS